MATYDPPTGETPLESNIYNNVPAAGGSTTAANNWAFQDFVSIFGRNPTASELANLSGSYSMGDKNLLDQARGKQTIAQYYQSIANSPANVYSRQQEQWSKQAPQNYGTVGQMIKSILGRDATQQELSHYGTLIASGQADPYEIQQFIQSSPEYQNAQDTQFRQGVDTQLQKSDTDFFNTQKGNIAQQYAQMGRATSPALDVALTQLASQLNSNRTSYLAQLSAQQYGGNKANAVGQYAQTQSDVSNRINQNTQGIYGANQALNGRLNNISDYNRQIEDYNNQMGRQNKPGWMDYLNTGLNVINTAAKTKTAFA